MTDGADDTPGVLTFPPLIYLIAVVVGWGLERLLPLPAPEGTLRWAIAGLLLAAGLALVAFAVPQFVRLRTHVSVHRPATALITAGAYRVTRNPLYIALALLQASLGVAAGLPWAVVTIAPALVVVHLGVVRREERYLGRKFGQAYRDYTAAVPRWL